MKTPLDPRHQKRQETVKMLFAESFIAQKGHTELIKKILENKESIDDKIETIAPEFPIDKINKVDLAILRLGVYELSIAPEAPQKVVIDEAIELAKEFGGENSASFINGALGKLVKDSEKK